jgi:protein phosphatase
VACDAALGLFLVADGMGGHAGGATASRLVVEAMRGGLDTDPDPDKRLAHAILAANRLVFETARRDPTLRGMGAAVVAILIDPASRVAAVVHAGDARAYRVRDGRLEQLTEDHTLVQELVRAGHLDPADAETHPQRHVLTRAVGVELDLDFASRVDSLEDGDVLLLTSDGLHGCVTSSELIAAATRSATDPAEACAHLVELGNARGGPDNLSVVLVHVGPGGGQLDPPPGRG